MSQTRELLEEDPSETESRGMPSEDAGGTNSESPVPSCIRFFRKGNSDQLLIAAVEPSEDFPAGIATDAIQGWVRGQGCKGWFLHEETISQLARELRRLEKPKEYTVAERKDCSIEVQMAPDRLNAWIRVSPALGGESLTEALLRRALEEHHICFGVKEDRLQQIVQNGECEKELIAEGVAPVQGEKAQFEPLVVESAQNGIP